MTRRKTAAPTPPETEPDDGPNPERGGAWYRKADGSLVRDRTEEQHVPEDERPSAAEVDAPVADAPSAPGDAAAADFAGFNEEGQ